MQRGDRVGLRYEIVGETARGGMGTVFRARDRKTGHDVAVKVVGAAGDRERFAREAVLLATVQHPNIVGYISHGADYLVMEWVDGETLASVLAAGIAPARALAIVRQLAAALAALHAAGIVHRDIKPSNVMLVADTVKLVDFGIARRAAGDLALTRTGAMVGTAGYMAPEQARADRTIDARADLFALGCVLYECLTGAPAFRGDSIVALRAKVLLHDPPRLRSIAPELPAALEELVGRLLAREPADRPASAVEVEAALAAIAIPSSAARVAASRDDATRTSGSGPHAVVLYGGGAPSDEVTRFAGRPVHAFEGAIAITFASLDEAAVIAAALAQLGVTAVARSIDGAARVLDELELAAIAHGGAATGAWLAAEDADQLPADRLGERAEGRVRLRMSEANEAVRPRERE